MNENEYKTFTLALWGPVFQFMSIFSADLEDRAYGLSRPEDFVVVADDIMSFGALPPDARNLLEKSARRVGGQTLTTELANWHIIANAFESGFTDEQSSFLELRQMLSSVFELWDRVVPYSQWEKSQIDFSSESDQRHVHLAGEICGAASLVKTFLSGVPYEDLPGVLPLGQSPLEYELARRRYLRYA